MNNGLIPSPPPALQSNAGERPALPFCGWRPSKEALEQRFVIRVCAHPEPDDQTAAPAAQGTILRVDAHRPHICKERFEMQRRIEVVLLPEPETLPGLLLHVGRERVETLPEIAVGARNHGESSSWPRLMSSSTRASNGFSLPSARSRRICASQSSSAHPCRQRATSARSSRLSFGMLALISSTVMRRIYGKSAGAATHFPQQDAGREEG